MSIFKQRKIIIIVFIYLIGFFLLYMRSQYKFTLPQIYTEDGVWTSMILRKGLIHTLLFATDRYFTMGQVLLLQLSIMINYCFYGLNISNLPIVIAVIQYTFYLTTLMLPLFLLSDEIHIVLNLFFILLGILIPLGNSGYEIFGVINNTGFLFSFISFVLVFYRTFYMNDIKKIRIIFLDTSIFLTLVSNPLSYYFLLLSLIYEFRKMIIKMKNNSILFRDKSYIVLIISASISILLKLIMLHGNTIHEFVLNTNSIIEFINRLFLFSFTFSFYNSLNDYFSIILIIFFLIPIYFSYRYLDDINLKSIIQFILLSLFGVFIIILLTRSGLTQYLDNYSTSWVDRYYYSSNIIFNFTFIFILSKIYNKHKRIIYFFIIFIFITYIYKFDDVFEFKNARFYQFNIISSNSFSMRLEQGYNNNNMVEYENMMVYRIEIEFIDWFMYIPEKYVINSLKSSVESE